MVVVLEDVNDACKRRNEENTYIRPHKNTARTPQMVRLGSCTLAIYMSGDMV
jgi:hypothetical protein